MNFLTLWRRYYIRLAFIFLLIGCVLILPSCNAPTEPPSDGGGNGGTIDDAPIVYSEGLAYEKYQSGDSSLDGVLQGIPVFGGADMCIITGIGSCTDTNIVIPPTIDGMRVIGIAPRAFSGSSADAVEVEHGNGLGTQSLSSVNGWTTEAVEEQMPNVSIESVTIPATVVSIGKEAFLGCEELSEVSATSLIRLIGQDAFKDTAFYNDPANWEGDLLYLENYLVSAKQSVSGNVSIKDGTTVIAARTFYGCTSLSGVSFPDSIVEVGEYAFYGCNALQSVDLNCKKLYIGEYAFENCSSLHTVKLGFDGELYYPGMPGVEINYETVTDANGVSVQTEATADASGRPYVYPCAIRYHAFTNCTALKNVELRETVNFIGGAVFKGCSSLESIIIPDAVTSLNMGTIFVECTSLKKVDFGSGLTVIGTQTFYKCPALTELYFPNGVTTVSDVAWFSGIKKIRLGADVTSFTWTQNNLEYVEFGGTMAEWKQLTSKSIVFLAPSHTIVCRDGTITQTAPPVQEDPKEIYQSVTPDIYNAEINGAPPRNYSSFFNYKTGEDVYFVHTVVTENGFHQIMRAFDGERWELRGENVNGELTVYTKRNGKWYLSDANMYSPGSDPREWKLPFDILSCDDETFLYSYSIDDIGAEISLGFRENRLVFAGLSAEDVEQTTEYFDFGVSELPAFSADEVEEGVILDINGNVVS